MIPAAARACVERYPLCFIATIREDGAPNLSPKGSIRVWDADHLLFANIAPVTEAVLVRAGVICQVCERARATHTCPVGCRYCGECAVELGMRCRNCGGELTAAAAA